MNKHELEAIEGGQPEAFSALERNGRAINLLMTDVIQRVAQHPACREQNPGKIREQYMVGARSRNLPYSVTFTFGGITYSSYHSLEEHTAGELLVCRETAQVKKAILTGQKTDIIVAEFMTAFTANADPHVYADSKSYTGSYFISHNRDALNKGIPIFPSGMSNKDYLHSVFPELYDE
jgi:hypothetical protein